MRQIQLFKTTFLIVFHCIYDVIRLHQVSGSSNYDDVMTKQVPGVPGAKFVGRHLPSVPKYRLLDLVGFLPVGYILLLQQT